jgi:hypothetical protein
MPKSKHRKKKVHAASQSTMPLIATFDEAAQISPEDHDLHLVMDLSHSIGVYVPPHELGPQGATPFIGYLKDGLYGAAVLWSIDRIVNKDIVPPAAAAEAEHAAGEKMCITILTEPERFDAWCRVMPEGLPVISSATWGKPSPAAMTEG